MELLSGPAVEPKPARPTLGIRTVTPFRGMFAVRDTLMSTMYARLDERGLQHGPAFFRLHVINMDGPMDIEAGVVLPAAAEGDEVLTAGELPPGDYATLTYVNHGRRANKTLVEWIRSEGLRAAVSEDPSRDEFACRYEAYLTDPRTEPKKTRWQTELSILLA